MKVTWQHYRTGGWRPLFGWVRSPHTVVFRIGAAGHRWTVLVRIRGSR